MAGDDEEMGDYYDDDDYNYSDDDEVNYIDDGGLEDEEDVVPSVLPNSYTLLPLDEIRKRQQELIQRVSSTLLVSEVVATTLLFNYKWSNVDSLLNDWFANEEEVRAKVGLPSNSFQFRNNDELTHICGICFEPYPVDDKHFYLIDCGHLYCYTCWNGYLTTAIKDGPGCLSLRCPEPKCKTSVCLDLVDKVVGGKEKEKYYHYLLRSYVEVQKKVKWCPAPGCENAAEFELGSDVYDVTCHCGHVYCWNCSEETHRPVDCVTTGKWVLKNSSESENVMWILANSKPCPKCNRAIEKNHGCMHMTCTPPCSFEFCWLCLGDWKEHGKKTGGYYSCNKYEAKKAQGLLDEEETKQQMAKSYLEKYTHYFERWQTNHKSRMKASEDLVKMKTENYVDKLIETMDKPETELLFIYEAWEQIIKCRRVLKWSYAYAYYMPEAKREYFEYQQGEAEANLEKLHHCAEQELRKDFFNDIDWLKDTAKSNDCDPFYGEKKAKQESEEEKQTREAKEQTEKQVKFPDFRQKLVNLTRVTGIHFEKLVQAIEAGLL